MSVACEGARRSEPERVASQSSAVGGEGSQDDTGSQARFPAVGMVTSYPVRDFVNYGICTATLVSDNVALTSAHCFEELASGCHTFANENWFFTLSVGGTNDDAGKVSWPIDDIAIRNFAYPHASDCAEGAAASCDEIKHHEVSGRLDRDFALLHLKVGPGDRLPSQVAKPMPIVLDPTGKFDPNQVFGSRSGVPGILAGWGGSVMCNTDFTCDHHGELRRWGPFDFTFDANWSDVCVPVRQCLTPFAQDSAGFFFSNGPLIPSGSAHCADLGAPDFFPTGAIKFKRQGDPCHPQGSFGLFGDSGAPLLVRVTVSPNDHEYPPALLSQDPQSFGAGYYIIGTDSTALVRHPFNGCGSTELNGGVLGAATFLSGNGAWLEQHIRDWDGDGQDDYKDNCPLIGNHTQPNTNFHAEVRLSGLIDGHLPPAPDPNDDDDTKLYRKQWHDAFHGDACDPDSSTQVSTFRTQDPRLTNVCNTVQVAPGGIHTTTGGTCPVDYTSGIAFDSWIGDATTGDAPFARGQTGPRYCTCPIVTSPSSIDAVFRCDRHALYKCLIARDDQFTTPTQSNWSSMTAVQFLGQLPLDYPFDPLDTVHQELSDLTSFVTQTFRLRSVRSVWDFLADIPRLPLEPPNAHVISGLLWAHVTSFAPSEPICMGARGACENALAVNRNNNYRASTVSRSDTTIRVNFDLGTTLGWLAMGWAPQHLGLPSEVVWLGVTPGTSPHLLQESLGGTQDVTADFSVAARQALAAVGAGSAELLVADDYAGSLPFQTTEPAAVLVQPSTLAVIGALSPNAAGIDFAPAKHCIDCITSDPPLRTYGGSAGKLFSLSAAGGAATLVAVDVAAALRGVNQTSTTDVHGDVPVEPLAMAYLGSPRSLIVADKLSVGRRAILRVVSVSIDGRAEELWRTTASRAALSDVRLSTSGAFIVLTLRVNGRTEVLLMTSEGEPVRSLTVEGRTIAPVITRLGAFTLPMSRRARGSHSNLEVRVVPHADATPGLCGVRWLRRHVDPTRASPLLISKSLCDRHRGDGDDDGNGEDDREDDR